MDIIDKIIHYAETGEKLEEDENDPHKIYQAIDLLRHSNHYYFLQWYIATKEFHRSKLTRSNFIPKQADEETGEKIDITIHTVSESDTEKKPMLGEAGFKETEE